MQETICFQHFTHRGAKSTSPTVLDQIYTLRMDTRRSALNPTVICTTHRLLFATEHIINTSLHDWFPFKKNCNTRGDYDTRKGNLKTHIKYLNMIFSYTIEIRLSSRIATLYPCRKMRKRGFMRYI